MTTPIPVDSIGGPHHQVSDADLAAFITRNLAAVPLDGRTVVLVVPDGTRSMPLPLVMRIVYRALIDRVASLSAVIALGTHAPMDPGQIERMFGAVPGGLDQLYPGLTIRTHAWHDPSQIVQVGTLSADQIEQLSQGAVRQDVAVEINRHVVEADYAIVIGPVFPHEVVGISGGNKYFIPGCATHEIIDLSHWVGALIGVETMIGSTEITPVRAIINAGSDLIDTEKLALCLVVQSGTGMVEAAAFGTSEDAWAATAPIAAESHIVYLDRPVQRMLAIMPTRYDDIWTAAKGCYKAQPAMADGGEVIIYAPHVSEVSQVHREIYQIGYHCMEYFTKQAERFAWVPKGVLAHSTHVRGAGSYDPQTGIEQNRIQVTLATGIPAEVCAQVNLGYRDPASIDVAAWQADPQTMVVENAGEVLFRLR